MRGILVRQEILVRQRDSRETIGNVHHRCASASAREHDVRQALLHACTTVTCPPPTSVAPSYPSLPSPPAYDQCFRACRTSSRGLLLSCCVHCCTNNFTAANDLDGSSIAALHEAASCRHQPAFDSSSNLTQHNAGHRWPLSHFYVPPSLSRRRVLSRSRCNALSTRCSSHLSAHLCRDRMNQR